MDHTYIFRREHPDHRKNREIWQRSMAAYSGGENYIRQALIQHVSEVDLEYQERLKRACYFNYPRKIAQLITQYIMAEDPERLRGNAELIEDFSRTGLRVNEVMRQLSTILNICGSAWLLIEMPAFDGKMDSARQRAENIRPYAVALSPLEVVDYSYHSDGKLNWVLIKEEYFDNSSVFAEPVTLQRRRLWTRDEWQLFEEQHGEVKLIASGKHDLGVVPLIHVRENNTPVLNCSHWFEDVVRISDAILNNESEAQMNIIKQMFGLLVISENFARGSRPARSENSANAGKFSHVLARSAAIWESSEESGISRYIAPNGAETTTIRSENQHLKAELFDVVGLTIIRETREVQSAESKAWDHQQICQFLLNRVDLLEQTEFAAWQIMHLYDPAIAIPQIVYNRDFSAFDLQKSIASLLELRSIPAGREYQKEIARAAVNMLNRTRKIPPERQQIIYDEIEQLADLAGDTAYEK